MKLKMLFVVLALSLGSSAHAQGPMPTPEENQPPAPDQSLMAPPTSEAMSQAISPDCSLCAAAEPGKAPGPFSNFKRDPDAYSIVSVARGLSTHRPMYLLPFTWSPDYDSKNAELIFQISAKQRLFGSNFYFGYTQRSFWQVYNGDDSRPFRDTDYNPEFFYRWTADAGRFRHWGADIGIEHESNGESVQDSRSWNRIYFAPFRAKGSSLVYLKAWYRLPEDEKVDAQDTKGDDNPDIGHYYGYGELHLEKQLGNGQLIHLMARGNLNEGNGAINIDYTIPTHGGYGFYQVYLWHGYGESLLDYNDSVTRLGFGFALAR